MLNKFLLHEKREEDFAKWYDRWFKKQNFEKQIKIRNDEGCNCLLLYLYKTPGFNKIRYDEFKRRARDNVKNDLKGIDVEFHEWGNEELLEFYWKVEYESNEI